MISFTFAFTVAMFANFWLASCTGFCFAFCRVFAAASRRLTMCFGSSLRDSRSSSPYTTANLIFDPSISMTMFSMSSRSPSNGVNTITDVPFSVTVVANITRALSGIFAFTASLIGIQLSSSGISENLIKTPPTCAIAFFCASSGFTRFDAASFSSSGGGGVVRDAEGLDLVAALDQLHLQPPLLIRGDLLVKELVPLQVLVREVVLDLLLDRREVRRLRPLRVAGDGLCRRALRNGRFDGRGHRGSSRLKPT